MPVFLAHGENDLDYAIPEVAAMVARFKVTAHPYQSCVLPAQSYFYSAATPVVADFGTPTSLEHAIEKFLLQYL